MAASATTPADGIIRPAKLAHFVLRSSRYAEIVAWY